jgi:hypothetical protein
MIPLGQRAYEAWRQELAAKGGVEGNRSVYAEWESLPVAEREAWQAMAMSLAEQRWEV